MRKHIELSRSLGYERIEKSDAATGFRVSELLGLMWIDLDLEG